jgi:hypothetical protein
MEERSLAFVYESARMPLRSFLFCRNMQEWLTWHLLMGVEYIYVVENNGLDQTVAALKPFQEAGVLEVGNQRVKMAVSCSITACGPPRELMPCLWSSARTSPVGPPPWSRNSPVVHRRSASTVQREQR